MTSGTPELTPAGKQPLLTSIFQCSTEFLEELRFYFEQNPPTIPISNIPGFTQFTAQAAPPIATGETTTSASWGDLATVGPILSNLPDGKYIFFYGAVANSSGASGNSAIMGVNVNGTNPQDGVYTASTTGTGIARASLATLSAGGDNTVKVSYESNTATPSGTFANRWLIGIRYANL